MIRPQAPSLQPQAVWRKAGMLPSLRLDMPEKRRSGAQDSRLGAVSQTVAVGMLVFASEAPPPRAAAHGP